MIFMLTASNHIAGGGLRHCSSFRIPAKEVGEGVHGNEASINSAREGPQYCWYMVWT